MTVVAGLTDGKHSLRPAGKSSFHREPWRPTQVRTGMYGYLKHCNNSVPLLCSYLGVTPPIATHESSQREKEVTVTLMEELRRQNTFESGEESRTRYVISSTNNTACKCPSHACYTNYCIKVNRFVAEAIYRFLGIAG